MRLPRRGIEAIVNKSQPQNGQKGLADEHRWKQLARWQDGFYALQSADTGDVPVRLFLTAELLTLRKTISIDKS